MNGFDFLNLVIGLLFIYLIYSIAASTIWEIIISITNLRGRRLRKWITNNFSKQKHSENKKFGDKIIEHPAIKPLLISTKNKPTYIPSEIFTDVLLDLIIHDDADEKDIIDMKIKNIKTKIKSSELLDQELKRLFFQYFADAGNDLQKWKEKVGNWYDQAMERLIGSYKKSLQLWIFVIAFFLVFLTNADTIQLANYLYKNPQDSAMLAQKADLFIEDTVFINNIKNIETQTLDSIAHLQQKELVEKLNHDVKKLETLNKELSETGLPIGWGQEDIITGGFLEWLKKIGGLLLTVFAVSLGSPFWFDILSKLANLRSSGNKPKSSVE